MKERDLETSDMDTESGDTASDYYEALELIVKVRADGVSWFDIISDYITQDCQGGGGDCIIECECDSPTYDCETWSDCDYHDHEPITSCTCGLESLGGMSGTLDQCYRWALGPDYPEDEDL